MPSNISAGERGESRHRTTRSSSVGRERVKFKTSVACVPLLLIEKNCRKTEEGKKRIIIITNRSANKLPCESFLVQCSAALSAVKSR